MMKHTYFMYNHLISKITSGQTLESSVELIYFLTQCDGAEIKYTIILCKKPCSGQSSGVWAHFLQGNIRFVLRSFSSLNSII